MSEQTSITIDLANKNGQIEYADLKTPRSATDLAEAGLQEIAEATDVDQHFTQLKLTSLEMYDKGNQLDAELKFSFENQNALLELMYFNMHPDGYLVYLILEKEKMISSNGKLIKEDGLRYIQWAKETNKIELKLKRGQLENDGFDEMVRLLKYWKN